MEELVIYEYQAKQIKETLRIVSNIFNSNLKETCIDRDIVRSIEYLNKILNKEP
jgi:hypothetical protein